MGKRQIFIRFAGCNLDCNYCDTKDSKDMDAGEYYTPFELYDTIEDLRTPDVDSIEITGGEPLLYADYIKEFLTEYPYAAMLETNGSRPKEIKKLKNVLDIVSLDIKLPEHFDNPDKWQEVYEKELKTVEVLERVDVEYYVKLVVLPTTTKDTINMICDDLEDRSSIDVEIILQPVSPMSQWENMDKILEFSEIVGERFPVSVIPQIHKYMNIE